MGLLPDIVKTMWKEAGGLMQPPDAVAQYLVHCIADGSLDQRAVVVAGGEAWESEEELAKLRVLGWESIMPRRWMVRLLFW